MTTRQKRWHRDELASLFDLNFAVDFRDIYATLVRRWLQVDPVSVLGRHAEGLRSV
jgi:hypothetical protein